jgi:hypothetical protein
VTDVLLIAHGLVNRSDLPIPEWLFGWAAALVLIVSFAGLAALWPEPKLRSEGWRPLRWTRFLVGRPVEIVCGALGVFLLGLVVYAGLRGTQSPSANFAPTFVYVVFWVGLVPVSAIFGDVFSAFNPWRAMGRAVAWVAQTAARGSLPAPLEYPERLGRWPAAAGIFSFAMLELVFGDVGNPRRVAIAVLIYTVLTFIAMALYGVEAWTRRGEAFSVYFNLFSRISPITRRGRELGLRKPLSALASLEPAPGTVAFVAVMIGTVTFDGAAEAPLWTDTAPHLQSFFESLGLAPGNALNMAFLVGLFAGVGVVYSLYSLGIVGVRSVGGDLPSRKLANTFAHTLVPIALAYVMAHYLTLLLFQGQGLLFFDPLPQLGFLASDPLGHGADIFGTANRQINYTVIGSNATWYFQVAFVVAGHVMGLILAHDRALALYTDREKGVRSQYWMLAVMIAFTSLALWLLSQSNV